MPANKKETKLHRNSIVHFEIPVDDVQRAKEFYEEVFGWKIDRMEMPPDPNSSTETHDTEPYYSVRTTETDSKNMVTTPGVINGGLMKRKEEGQTFVNYVSVENIDSTLRVIQACGGTIRMPKTSIGANMGWIASFEDTEGNVMGLHQMVQNDEVKGNMNEHSKDFMKENGKDHLKEHSRDHMKGNGKDQMKDHMKENEIDHMKEHMKGDHKRK